jgi:hypothetical protein
MNGLFSENDQSTADCVRDFPGRPADASPRRWFFVGKGTGEGRAPELRLRSRREALAGAEIDHGVAAILAFDTPLDLISVGRKLDSERWGGYRRHDCLLLRRAAYSLG